MDAPGPTVAVCLPARNSAATIERLVASVRAHVDELCFYIAGESTDGTPELLARLATEPGAQIKVKQGEWRNDYAEARMQSFAMAESDWIAWADDDEVFVGAERLRAYLATTDADYLEVRRVDLFTPSQPFAVFFPRLVRRDVGAWWTPAVHERLTAPDTVVHDAVPPPVLEIIHHPLPQDGRHDHRPLVEAELARGGDPELRIYLGRYLWDDGDLAGAAREFERVTVDSAARLPQKARAAQRLSMARFRLGDVVGATCAYYLHIEFCEMWSRERPEVVGRIDALNEQSPITDEHPVWDYAKRGTLFPDTPVIDRMRDSLRMARANGIAESDWAEVMRDDLGLDEGDIEMVLAESPQLVAV